MSRHQRTTLVRSGALVRTPEGPFVTQGSVPCFRRDLWVALLASGPWAFACRRSARDLWGLDALSRLDVPSGSGEPVDVAVSGGHHPRRRETVRLTGVTAGDLAAVEGIPVTSVGLTLLTLGAVTSPEEVEVAMESSLRRRLITVGRLETIAHGRSAAGAGTLRAILRRRPQGAAPTESLAETVFMQIARSGGLPEPTRQAKVVLGGRYCRLDHAWPNIRLATEIDGRSAHGPERLDADLRRQNDVVLDGWLLLRFSATAVLFDPDGVRSVLVRAFELRSFRREAPRS